MRNTAKQKSFLRYLEHQSHVFQISLKNLQSGQYGENLHQLRVSIRKLRTALGLFRNSAKISKARRMLKKLGKVTGTQREIEVASLDAAKYGYSLPSPKRIQAMNELTQCLNCKGTQDLALALTLILKELQHEKKVRISKPQKITKKLIRWRTLPLKTARQFHQLRIDVKKTRYLLEACGVPYRGLVELQDNLGRAHDLEILQKLVGRDERIKRKMLSFQKNSRKLLKPAIHFVKII